MNLITVFQKFPDHEACIEHLEEILWSHTPRCPGCGSDRVGRKADGYRQGRWNCHACHASFNVLSGTIFQKTKIELQKWFLAIRIILDAKEIPSSHQLARDIDVTQPTAWSMGMRIRHAAASQLQILKGIIEADEAFIGGKPQAGSWRDDAHPKNPNGDDKLPVTGSVDHECNAIAHPLARVAIGPLSDSATPNTDPGLLLLTKWHAWGNKVGKRTGYGANDPTVELSIGSTIANTIKRFCLFLRGHWPWAHRGYSRENMWTCVAETCRKYDMCNPGNGFEDFMQQAVPI